MAALILGPMLRHVTATSATIWVETDDRCSVTILDTTTPTFCVAGHHYALVVIEGLSPSTTIPYQVALDGAVRWPLDDAEIDRDDTSADGGGDVPKLPQSCIRTLPDGDRRAARIVFGSCRTAAPHVAPWSLELGLDPRGRGVDALYTYALEMLDHPTAHWPELAVFLGDQIYADDSSPRTRERIAAKRNGGRGDDGAADALPAELVDGFEEFTWLYQESWSSPIERWFFANVPSVMIFDDHEMVDDWNISDAWVRDFQHKPWWQEHVIGGLMTYWLYQHLGNLSPESIASEGLLAALAAVDDGHDVLREWAMKSEEFTGGADRYRFGFTRDIGRVRLVMVDARNGRTLEPGHRQIIDDARWQWFADACDVDVDHLLIASSLPVFVPGGLHDLQVWSEAICDGAWRRPGRRIGEWLRVKADMEDWPSFSRSFDAIVELLGRLGAAERTDAPTTISLLSGDIHFSYAAEIRFPQPMKSRVHQLVNSPIRNALTGPERTAMRLGSSHFASGLGRLLRRMVHRRPATVQWKMDRGPTFANCLGELTFDGPDARLRVQQARPYDEQGRASFDIAIDADLASGTRDSAGPSALRRRLRTPG